MSLGKLAAAAAATLASLELVSGAATCNFVQNTKVCVGPGSNCCANNNQYLVTAPPNDGVYQPAFCKVTFGSGVHSCGTGSAGPTFDQVYGSPCSGKADDYSCQFADPTLFGEEKFPSELRCEPNNGGTSYSCLLAAGIQRTGDPCLADSECASKNCVSGVCQGLPQNAACTTGGCAAGLYCHTSTTDTGHCLPIVGPGGACTKLESCAAGYLCNLADTTQPTCLQLFSVANGVKVNSADLCQSGHQAVDKTCSDPVPADKLGSACDCAVPSPISGGDCQCMRNNYCGINSYTLRTSAMVAARKAARQCFISKTAPDGTPCADAMQNIGLGETRNSEILMTCGWNLCNQEILNYASALGGIYGNPTYMTFDQDPSCVQSAKLSYTVAAGNGQISCYLPQALRNLGWTCSTDKPSGLTGGQKFGIAVAVLMPLGAIAFVGFALKTGRGPRFIHTGAAAVVSGWNKVTGKASYKALATSSTTSCSSSSSSSSAYAAIGSPNPSNPIKATSYQ